MNAAECTTTIPQVFTPCRRVQEQRSQQELCDVGFVRSKEFYLQFSEPCVDTYDGRGWARLGQWVFRRYSQKGILPQAAV